MIIKTKKNGWLLEKKIYKIIEDRYEELIESMSLKTNSSDLTRQQKFTRKDWTDYLDSVGIEHFHCDDEAGIVECLKQIVNESKDVVVCADPWADDNSTSGCDGLLAIPTQLAEKIIDEACYLNEDEIKELVDLDLDMTVDEIKSFVAKWKENCDRWSRELATKPEIAKELIDEKVKDSPEWNIVEAVIRKSVANKCFSHDKIGPVMERNPHHTYMDDLFEMVHVFG